MVTEKEIARINELYHKAKESGLTDEEKKEQMELRGRYIASIRQNLRAHLENIDIENPDGTIESVKDRRKAKFKDQ